MPPTSALLALVLTLPAQTAAEDEIVRVSDPGVVAPKGIKRPQPRYPATLRRERVQGVVQLDVLVDKDGRVLDVREKSGDPRFIDAVVPTVKTWEYRPATRHGRPVKVWIPVRIVFSVMPARPSPRRPR